jgi:hypothetical protein
MGVATPHAPLIDAAPYTGAASTNRQPHEGRHMIRVDRATPAENVPEDPAMRLIEVGLAILAIVAAGILAFIR